jgi:FtsP/CotA-like multicopper oxidase with cupredoxin domain
MSNQANGQTGERAVQEPGAPDGELSRRRFLTAGARVGTALALPGLLAAATGDAAGQADQPAMNMGMSNMDMSGRDVPDTTGIRAVPFKEGEPLVEPEVRRSKDGELQTTLTLRYAYKDVGGHQLFMRTFEGTIPGPTLRLRRGDRLRIRIVNDLPPNRDPMPQYMDQPHHLNTTNLHLHGSHVSPSGIADNVMRSMEPGQSYDVAIDFPADHTAGTYWYHPHHHGSADVQVASGMAGAVIIEGDFDGVPEIVAAKERTLVLGEVVFDGFGMIESLDTLFPEHAVRFLTVNGQRAPTIAMRPGEVQRWRLVHAGYQDDIFLLLQGHRLHPIARDGIALAHMDLPEIRTPDHTGDNPMGHLIAPGQRIDVLVQAGAPGHYELHGLPYDQGYASPNGRIATLVVAGDPLPMRLPERLPPVPLATIRDEEITGRRRLTFSSTAPEAADSEHWQEYKFQIDGRNFDMNRVDQRVRLGAVEEWTIVNLHIHDHIFHIHTNPFQLIKVNGVALADPVWCDTAVLPRSGSLTFRSRFLDFTGRFMLHCHMMNHEELGMMQVVEVYSGSSTTSIQP